MKEDLGVALPTEPGFPEVPQPEPPENNPIRRWSWLLLLCLLVGGYWWYSNQEEAKQTTSHELLEQKVSHAISEFGQKHDAVTEWAHGLPQGTVYSIDVQRALIRKDGRPILFTGRVADIRQNKETLQLEFAPIWDKINLRVILDCREDTINGILSHAPRETDYLAVAQIQSVGKVHFRVDARSEGVASTDYDDEGHSWPIVETFTELELEAGDVFLAHGTCVDVRPYPSTPNQ